MMKTRSDEDGIIFLGLLFLIAFLILGYVVINSVSKSREAEQVKDAAGEAIETVNHLRQGAESLIGN